MNLPSIVMSAPSGVDLMTTVDGSPAGLGAAGDPGLEEPAAGVAPDALEEDALEGGVPGAMLRASAGAAGSDVEAPDPGPAADAAGEADVAGCELTDLLTNLAASRVMSPLM